jgi:hypothetical protein
VLERRDAPGHATGLPRAVDAPAAALALQPLLQREIDVEQVDRLKRWGLVQDLTSGIPDIRVNRDSQRLQAARRATHGLLMLAAEVERPPF